MAVATMTGQGGGAAEMKSMKVVARVAAGATGATVLLWLVGMSLLSVVLAWCVFWAVVRGE